MHNTLTITLDADGDVAVLRGGVKVQFNATAGGIEIYGNVPVTVHPAANDDAGNAAREKLKIGDVRPDGTIYAGISPTTGTRMFVLPGDAPELMTWQNAARYAFNLQAHGYKGGAQQTERNLADARKDDGGWRLPSMAELKQLYRNKDAGALQGTFRERVSGCSDFGICYWSCTEHASNSSNMWIQRFTDGVNVWSHKDNYAQSVRCVRAEPRP